MTNRTAWRIEMQTPTIAKLRAAGPKRRKRHYSYDENVNEAAKLIEDEPVDVEREVPADENPPEQTVESEPDEGSPQPPFED
jgi:hypothetical protein